MIMKLDDTRNHKPITFSYQYGIPQRQNENIVIIW